MIALATFLPHQLLVLRVDVFHGTSELFLLLEVALQFLFKHGLPAQMFLFTRELLGNEVVIILQAILILLLVDTIDRPRLRRPKRPRFGSSTIGRK